MKALRSKKGYQKKRVFGDKVDVARVANIAFGRAYANAKKHRLPIVKRKNNKIVKVYPNGREEIIKTTRMVEVKKRYFSI